MSTIQQLPKLNKHIPIVQDGINIIHIGLGGTGSYVASDILRLIGGMDKGLQTRIRYIGIDGDTFEEKNLGRQLCIRADMGKNKAQAVVTRYSNAFEVSGDCASYSDEYIKSKDDILKYIHCGFTNIIIDNLDKNRPRTWINEALRQYITEYKIAYVYTISTGNGQWNGQVSMGCVHKTNSQILKYKPGTDALAEPYYFSIPSPYVVSPELLDTSIDDAEEAMSCADRAAANVQTLVANKNAASICFNFVNAIFTQFINQATGQEDVPQTVGTVRFNSINNDFKSEKLDEEYMSREVM